MEPKEFDMEAGVQSVVDGLGFEQDIPEAPELSETPEPIAAGTPVVAPVAAVTPTPDVPPPQSWAKDKHDLWKTLPPEAREQIQHREKQMLEGLGQYREHFDFGKAMKEAAAPFQPMMAQYGLDAPKAFATLLAAHQRLTSGTFEQRAAEYHRLGQAMGFIQQPGVDPAMREVMERQSRIEGELVRHQREQYEAHKQKISSEVLAFSEAKDEQGNPKHPYFDEVAEDIVLFINNGASLEDAYQRAVRANPVTFEKEAARIREETEKTLKAKSKQEAEAAKKASSTNVRSRDTKRSPTETLGKMEDTMKETLGAIRSRTH